MLLETKQHLVLFPATPAFVKFVSMKLWFWRTVRVRRRVRRKTTPGSKKQYALHKEAARILAHERIAHFNQFYQVPMGKVAIRNQKTRWGSCSKKGNLNFNYKIALLPRHLADYIVVHELCHIKEFNHSSRFWDLVRQTVPNPESCRAELRRGFKTS